MGYPKQAFKIYNAVESVMRKGDILTPDLGGSSTTQQVTDAILKAL
jgi:homoisocitrate dehydrogenase